MTIIEDYYKDKLKCNQWYIIFLLSYIREEFHSHSNSPGIPLPGDLVVHTWHIDLGNKTRRQMTKFQYGTTCAQFIFFFFLDRGCEQEKLYFNISKLIALISRNATLFPNLSEANKWGTKHLYITLVKPHSRSANSRCFGLFGQPVPVCWISAHSKPPFSAPL